MALLTAAMIDTSSTPTNGIYAVYTTAVHEWGTLRGSLRTRHSP